MNEIDIFKGVTNLPTFETDDLSMVNIGTAFDSIPRISIKGGQFTVMADGGKVPLSKEIHCVIVRAGAESRRYYAKPYSGEDGQAPDCASTTGINPDSTIENPMCDMCKTCPMNEWGSRKGFKGGKAKACTVYKRLAICVTNDGQHDIYKLDVPALSLTPLREYNTKLTKVYMVPVNAVVTKITIDTSDSFTKLIFKEFKALNAEEYATYKAMYNDPLVEKIITQEVAIMKEDEIAETKQPKKTTTKKTVAPKVEIIDEDGDLEAEIDAIIEEE